MGKFKVGDRVRCINDDGTSLVAGEAYAVDRVNEGWINVTVKGHSGGYFSSRFEPLAPTSPVRMRPAIVPGTYGVVRVLDSGDITLMSTRDPKELTAAIATLTTIRDALDEVA